MVFCGIAQQELKCNDVVHEKLNLKRLFIYLQGYKIRNLNIFYAENKTCYYEKIETSANACMIEREMPIQILIKSEGDSIQYEPRKKKTSFST